MPELPDVGTALREFAGDPQHASALSACLGFQPIEASQDLMANRNSPLSCFLDPRFGVSGLYRVGRRDADGGSVGLYVASVQWGERPRDRERARRRLARLAVEQLPDTRTLFVLVPHGMRSLQEAEFVLPRVAVGAERGVQGGVTTVRAQMNLREPTRFHRDLLRALAIPPGAALTRIAEAWHDAFSVERATTEFYRGFAGVRDALASELSRANPEHLTACAADDNARRTWATRQLCRMLFLWFLQAKRWLGFDGGGAGPSDYLIQMWQQRGASGCGYYSEVLEPLFYEAMAQRRPAADVTRRLGGVPYLNGGLFARNDMEERLQAGGTLRVPDSMFDPSDGSAILGFLNKYRFTVQEATPDDQSVDPDPELLGRVFENLYQGDERHNTGTYYTPREIVQFMCREALDGYLCDATSVDRSALQLLRADLIEPATEPLPITDETADRISTALDTLRMCDPAVGSGAFLLGMMHEMVALRRALLHRNRQYFEPDEEEGRIAQWKRRAIARSLYGVDVNPEAVELCRLRLWLSLVLDHLDPRTVEPLPNLDFRVVAGDSLIDRDVDIAFAQSLPRGQYQLPLQLGQRLAADERALTEWHREFEATGDNRTRLKELRKNIAGAHGRIVRMQLEAAIVEAEWNADHTTSPKDANKLRERALRLRGHLETLSQDAPVRRPFLWPLEFPEVFDQGGFDVVLANPPYVRQENLPASDQQVYRHSFADVHAGTADLHVYFYSRALQVLCPRGWLSFVTSNKYMRAGYGVKLREALATQLVLQRVLDFGDLPLFEANGKDVAAYPAVVVGRRSGDTGEHTLRVADLTDSVREELSKAGQKVSPESVRSVLSGLEPLLNAVEVRDYPQVLLKNGGWMLEEPELVRLFHRLMGAGTPLGEAYGGRVFRGVLTGLNEAFVIHQAKRDELIAADPRSADLIRPWLRGRDVKRWQPEWARLYVVAVQNSGDSSATNVWANAHSENDALALFKRAYPAICDHLSQYENSWVDRKGKPRSGLRPRADQGRFWWELRACSYYGALDQPKVIWPDITRELRFAWDSRGFYVDTTVFFMDGVDRSLLALLNSSVAQFVLSFLTYAIRGGYLRLKNEFLVQFPLPPLSPSLRVNLQNGAEEEDDSLVDEMAADAYGLTQPERRVLTDWRTRRGASEPLNERSPDDDE